MGVIVEKDIIHAAAEQERYLCAILESPGFRKARTLQNLLSYLWQHRSEAITEYSIGVDALGRRADFDPALDATVRVNVARLRQKLKEFYETEGRTFPVIISIPLGRHVLEFRPNRGTEVAVRAVAEAPAIPSRNRTAALPWALSIALVLVSSVCVAQFVLYRRAQTSSAAQDAAPARFWRGLVSNGKPNQLFLPTPVFFEWGTTSLKVRDPAVNDFSELGKSAELNRLGSKLGPPRLMQNYTFIGDTLAALKLSRYLEKSGISLSFSGTSELTEETAVDHNVILVGTAWVTGKFANEPDTVNFQFTEKPNSPDFEYNIVNRHPRSREPVLYRTTNESDSRSISFGLITVLPGKGSSTRVLSLRGRPSPLGLISFLTVPDSLERLDQAWRGEGSPEYFEAVVGAEFDGLNVLRTWLEAIRAIHPPASGNVLNSQVNHK